MPQSVQEMLVSQLTLQPACDDVRFARRWRRNRSIRPRLSRDLRFLSQRVQLLPRAVCHLDRPFDSIVRAFCRVWLCAIG
jgi:hypothetical protein